MIARICLTALALILLAIPARAAAPGQLAQDSPSNSPRGAERSLDRSAAATSSSHSSPASGSNIGWRGWGLRVGLADDVDQVVGGAHFNLGEFAPRVRFQPDVQLGSGDDFTTLYGTAPVYYRFGTDTPFTPYAGGGVALGYVDHDRGGVGRDDSEFEVGAKATGGLEWPKPDGQSFFVELSLGFGDVHDATVMAAWSF